MGAKPKGAVAAGHELTAHSAAQILRAGGNAFDAIIAAHFSACVVEPVLTSLGGGGFMLAHTPSGQKWVYDFFAHTPKQRAPIEEIDFYPISADFGTAQQQFYIGRGTIAVPGTIKGLFTIHEELGSLPMARLMEPAIDIARQGVRINDFQAYIFQVVNAIFQATPEAKHLFQSPAHPEQLVQEGDLLRQPHLADTLEALAREGETLMYQGEIGRRIVELCSEHRGHVSAADLAGYSVIKRPPLELDYGDSRLLTNPPPSSGGILMAFALQLLQDCHIGHYNRDSGAHLRLLVDIMGLTNKARIDAQLEDASHPNPELLLDKDYVALYRQEILRRAPALRGTTHISVIDSLGNIASLSTSNGEGCGHMVPDTGIMLNNMLGEEDLNPLGFHRWPHDQRMTSMMAPSMLIRPQGRVYALGSGGSNRLRTAILQVLINLVDFDLSLSEAVDHPRIHYEHGLVNIEAGYPQQEFTKLLAHYPQHKLWPDRNLFFGGTHSVMYDGNGFDGAGDPRRGGVAIVVN